MGLGALLGLVGEGWRPGEDEGGDYGGMQGWG
jgi:hypothetical protein